MTAMYPLLTQEEPVTAAMLASGLAFMSPATRNYIEVLPNYVRLHLAVWTNRDGVTGRIIVPAGEIPEAYRPNFAVRGTMTHGNRPVTVLWRDNGQVEIEGAYLADQQLVNGMIEAKRRTS